MSDTLDLVHLFLGWLLLDLIGLITFIKPVDRTTNWKNGMNFRSFIPKKHVLFSIVTELIGIILLVISFSIPWYYHLFGVNHFQYLYFIEAVNLDGIFIIYLYYAYLIGLCLLFLKISIKQKLQIRYLIEVTQILFIIPGIILIFNVKFELLFYLAILIYIKSGYSSGFVLYTIGISVLIMNGLQFSIYSRLKRI